MSESAPDTSSDERCVPGDYVPETVSQEYAPPKRTRRIGLLLGVPGLWVMPTRILQRQ